jgi:hypothetical protein
VLPLLGAVALAGVVPVATASSPATSPTRVQVRADEFSLTLSRTHVRRGAAVLQLYNMGEDDHDLALRRIAKGARTWRIPVVTPGGLYDLDARLQPGRYRLWCTLADHRARGMSATLVVRRG